MRYQFHLLQRAREQTVGDSFLDCPLVCNCDTEEVQALQHEESQPPSELVVVRQYHPIEVRHRAIYTWLFKLVFVSSGTEGLELSIEELCGALTRGFRSSDISDDA